MQSARPAAVVVVAAAVVVSYGKRRGTESHPARRRERYFSVLVASISPPRYKCVDPLETYAQELLQNIWALYYRSSKNSVLSTSVKSTSSSNLVPNCYPKS